MTIDTNTAHRIWTAAATAKGWRYSPAHGGWIRDSHVDHSRYGEGGHPSDLAAEDACFIDGIETLADAVRAADALAETLEMAD